MLVVISIRECEALACQPPTLCMLAGSHLLLGRSDQVLGLRRMAGLSRAGGWRQCRPGPASLLLCPILDCWLTVSSVTIPLCVTLASTCKTNVKAQAGQHAPAACAARGPELIDAPHAHHALISTNNTLWSSQLRVEHMALQSDAFQRLYPAAAYAKYLEQSVRPDGRALAVCRATSIGFGVVQTADSSALVRVGRTTVLAGIKCEVMAGIADAPDEGRLTLQVRRRRLSVARVLVWNLSCAPPGPCLYHAAVQTCPVLHRGPASTMPLCR